MLLTVVKTYVYICSKNVLTERDLYNPLSKVHAIKKKEQVKDKNVPLIQVYTYSYQLMKAEELSIIISVQFHMIRLHLIYIFLKYDFKPGGLVIQWLAR